MNTTRKIPRPVTFLFWMTLLTGVVYPAAITGIAQLAFREKANGSLVRIQGEVRGSRLLSQEFAGGGYFMARPSATGYAYLGSAGSNLAATNKALSAAAKGREDAWRARFGSTAPAEMRYTSASGLDPDISLEAALAQVGSVSRARGLSATQETALVEAIRKAGKDATTIIAIPRVNVMELNFMLEADPAFRPAGK